MVDKCQSKDLRIAIIGAGISGLFAAHALKGLGYNHITIFEANETVGGRIHTKEINGELFEVGAVFSLDSLIKLNRLAKKFDQPLERINKSLLYLSKGQKLSMFKYLRQEYGWLEILRASQKFFSLMKKHKYFLNTGYTRTDPELFMYFSDYAKKYRLDPIVYGSEPNIVQYGYGRMNQLPTMYLMKNSIYNFKSMGIKEQLNSALPINLSPYLKFKKGFQSLPEAMARDLDVRLKTRVSRVTRKSHNGSFLVQLAFGNEAEEFDRVIITATPNQIVQFLDMTPGEEEIFSKVKFNRFHSILYYADGLPDDGFFVPVECVEKAEQGYPCTIAIDRAETRLFMSWQLTTKEISVEKLDQALVHYIKELGGNVKKIVFREDHVYFPHFSETDLREINPYVKIEHMQGENGCYFLGSLFNGELVEYCIDYADYIIEKHF